MGIQNLLERPPTLFLVQYHLQDNLPLHHIPIRKRHIHRLYLRRFIYSELSNFTTFIRQITQGRGWFTTEFARYEILPEMLVPAVVEQAKKLGNLDEGAED